FSDDYFESLRNSIFFFQAEDGIRDRTMTGVQTCALPISLLPGQGGQAAHGPEYPAPSGRPRQQSVEEQDVLDDLSAGAQALGHLIGEDASERNPADAVGTVGLMLAQDPDVILREFLERRRFGPL